MGHSSPLTGACQKDAPVAPVHPPVLGPVVLRADGLLLLAAIIWGAAFVAQRIAMRHMGPLSFNGIRFALGALVLLPVIRGRPSLKPTDGCTPGAGWLRDGVLTGCVLFVAASLQQIGIVHTTAGKAGFITGLYVVCVPIFGAVVGQRTRMMTWTGAGLAAVGLYFLSVTGAFEVARGDGLVLGCAIVCAVHVLLIGWLAPRVDPFRLAAVQFTVTAVLSLVAAVCTEQITSHGIWAAKWAILYGGVGSVGVAYTLQVVGQRTAPPAHAAILLSFEAVFAALTGWLMLDERLSARQFMGCMLMLAGVLASQMRREPAGRAEPLES